MSRFSRLVPFLGNLFPPYAGEPTIPSELTDVVHLTHKMFRGGVEYPIKNNAVSTSGAGAGVDISFTAVFGPVDSGEIVLPIALILGNMAGAVTQAVRWQIADTALGRPVNPILHWTTFVTPIPLGAGTLPVGPFRRAVPCHVPLVSGNAITVTFPLVPIGTLVTVESLSVSFAIELMDWTRVRPFGVGIGL